MKENVPKKITEAKEKRKKTVKIAGLIRLAVMILAATLVILPWLWKIGDLRGEESREALDTILRYTDAIGFWKYPLALFFQVLQIVVAIIPGGPMQIVMGFLFGTFLGTLLSAVGIVIATWIIIWGVRKWGMRFARLFVKEEHLDKLNRLGGKKKRKRDTILFLLFLVPGTPKDVLTYFAPLSGVSPMLLTLMVTAARFPSLLSSVYIGATLSEGNFAMSAIVFATTAVIGICGILLYEGITERKQAEKERSAESEEEDAKDHPEGEEKEK